MKIGDIVCCDCEICSSMYPIKGEVVSFNETDVFIKYPNGEHDSLSREDIKVLVSKKVGHPSTKLFK